MTSTQMLNSAYGRPNFLLLCLASPDVYVRHDGLHGRFHLGHDLVNELLDQPPLSRLRQEGDVQVLVHLANHHLIDWTEGHRAVSLLGKSVVKSTQQATPTSRWQSTVDNASSLIVCSGQGCSKDGTYY